MERPECRIVVARGERRTPAFLDFRFGRQRGDGGIGHGQRAADRGFDLAQHVDHRGMAEMAAGRAVPGQGGVARGDARRHQPVIAGMEAHLVKPPPGTVEGMEFGRIMARALGRVAQVRRGEGGAEARGIGGRAAPERHPVAQRRIRGPGVAGGRRAGLVADRMGREVVARRGGSAVGLEAHGGSFHRQSSAADGRARRKRRFARNNGE